MWSRNVDDRHTYVNERENPAVSAVSLLSLNRFPISQMDLSRQTKIAYMCQAARQMQLQLRI